MSDKSARWEQVNGCPNTFLNRAVRETFFFVGNVKAIDVLAHLIEDLGDILYHTEGGGGGGGIRVRPPRQEGSGGVDSFQFGKSLAYHIMKVREGSRRLCARNI